MVGFHFSGQMPDRDLAQRYGNSLSPGTSFTWKTKQNILVSVSGSYFFGKNVKDNITVNMRNNDGFIVNNDGFSSDLRITERGWNFQGSIGYIIPKTGFNKNCGLFFTLGAGHMQHKIKLYDAEKKVAAVHGDYYKGYDRYSGGFALSQFVGYMYLSNNRLANCYIGIEAYEGFTKSYRGYNYDTGLADTKQRFDVLKGIRIGWILPLYKRTKDFYYN